MSLVTAAATLAICVLALGGTTNTAEAKPLPKNGKIAFNRNGALYAVEPDGSGLSPLSKDIKPTYWPLPAWSPDGTKLAFEDEGRLWVIDADGSDPKMLPTHGLEVGRVGLAWSPNGERLVFQGKLSVKEPSKIYTMNLDGSSMTDVTNSPESYEERFDILPDGSRLCFERIDKVHVQGRMFVMDVDATAPPAWSVLEDRSVLGRPTAQR